MKRYEAIESKVWIGPDGMTASIYGAVPYNSEADKDKWSIKVVGWTIRDTVNNTVGIGRMPWDTKGEAEAWIDTWEKKRAAQ